MSKKTSRKAIEKLEQYYAQLPRIQCKGLCSVACGPVPMSILEANRMHRTDTQKRLPMIHENLECVYLTPQKRCSVYAVRPLICRVWGTAKNLSCMHGCTPDRWLSLQEFVRIARAVEILGGGLVVSATHGLVRDPEQSFLTLSPQTLSDEEVERGLELTRNLRALHGGRITAALPGNVDGPAKWINGDE